MVQYKVRRFLVESDATINQPLNFLLFRPRNIQMAIESCLHCKEPIYSGTSVCPHCKKKMAQSQPTKPSQNYEENPKKPLQTYEELPQKTASNLVEYRRTCQVCGKVWHSLISREKKVVSSQKSDLCMMCAGALQVCGGRAVSGSVTHTQASKNLSAKQSELHRLRSCPQCNSVNYKEEIIDHANQLG